MSKCQHLITDENDECYPCKITALFRIIGEREESLAEEKEKTAKLAGYCREHGEISSGKLAEYIGWSRSAVHAHDSNKAELTTEKERSALLAGALEDALPYFEGEHSHDHPTTKMMQNALSTTQASRDAFVNRIRGEVLYEVRTAFHERKDIFWFAEWLMNRLDSVRLPQATKLSSGEKCKKLSDDDSIEHSGPCDSYGICDKCTDRWEKVKPTPPRDGA